jgi:hypothetical protein
MPREGVVVVAFLSGGDSGLCPGVLCNPIRVSTGRGSVELGRSQNCPVFSLDAIVE